MVYIYMYLPVLCYHGYLHVTEGVMQASGFFRCSGGLSCFISECYHGKFSIQLH